MLNVIMTSEFDSRDKNCSKESKITIATVTICPTEPDHNKCTQHYTDNFAKKFEILCKCPCHERKTRVLRNGLEELLKVTSQATPPTNRTSYNHHGNDSC